MKKTTFLFAFSFAFAFCKAQLNWTTEIMNTGSYNANLGTSNNKCLNFFVYDTARVIINTGGLVKVRSLQGDGDRIIMADQYGNLRPVGGTPQCGTVPWVMGGNTANGANNLAGTCNAMNFIMMANNKKSITINSSSGFVGVGENNGSPGAALDICNPASSNTHHLKIFGDAGGAIESSTDLQLFYNSTFNLIQGSYGTNFNASFTIDNAGKVGIGGTPVTKLTINSGSSDGVQNRTSSGTTKALSVYNTGTSSENFIVFGDGKTNIGHQSGASNAATLNINVAGGSNATNAINVFDQYSSNVTFKVKSDGKTIIGTKTETSVAHTGALLTVYGKMVCKEAVVTISDWADYVFAKDYNLPPLKRVENYYLKHGHLEGIPSEKEVREKGVNIGEMEKLLLMKIEENTIYIVGQNKTIESQQEEIAIMKKQIAELQRKIK